MHFLALNWTKLTNFELMQQSVVILFGKVIYWHNFLMEFNTIKQQ